MTLNRTQKLLALAIVMLGALVVLELVRIADARRFAVSGGSDSQGGYFLRLFRGNRVVPEPDALAVSPPRRDADGMWGSLEHMRRMQAEIDRLFIRLVAASNTTGWSSNPAALRHRGESARGDQPFEHVRRMQADIDRLFEQTIRDFDHFCPAAAFDEGWDQLAAVPALDIHDGGTNYLIALNLAGADPDTIRVTLEGRLLSISAQQAAAGRDPGRASPSGVTRFERRIRLPGPVADVAGCRAACSNGLLHVIVPKTPVPEFVGNEIHIQL